jgi:hypothetical protein
MTDDVRAARGVDLGRRFIDGIVAHDWQAIADCFEPEAHFRAVIPTANPFRDHVGGDAAADQLRRWFGDADITELLECVVEPMEDRFRLAYRIHEREPDGWFVVEQQAYITIGERAIRYMNLLCSGFRPADP